MKSLSIWLLFIGCLLVVFSDFSFLAVRSLYRVGIKSFTHFRFHVCFPACTPKPVQKAGSLREADMRQGSVSIRA